MSDLWNCMGDTMSDNIDKALALCGNDWRGIAFDNLKAIYESMDETMPCNFDKMSIKAQAKTGLSKRKIEEKLKVVISERVVIKDNGLYQWVFVKEVK